MSYTHSDTQYVPRREVQVLDSETATRIELAGASERVLAATEEVPHIARFYFPELPPGPYPLELLRVVVEWQEDDEEDADVDVDPDAGEEEPLDVTESARLAGIVTPVVRFWLDNFGCQILAGQMWLFRCIYECYGYCPYS